MTSATRTEKDTFGPIEVPADRLWGAQTQRSLQHFKISGERMPPGFIRGLALVKKACALVNMELGLLDEKKGRAIVTAADEVWDEKHDDEFPLVIWQTGSGTQSNMNMNEVLANRASELLGGPRGEGRLVHPNDDVNMGQSSNDVFPTAMHVAAVEAVRKHVRPVREGPARHAAEEGRRVPRHREDRPHAPAGRDAAHPGPGVLGLRLAARPRARPPRRGAAPPVRAGPGRHRRRHRPQRPSRVRSARRQEAGGADRPSLRDRAQQVRGAGQPRRHGQRARRLQDAGRLAHQDRERRALAGLRSRARASARSPSPRTSRAARSCRAR